MDEYMVTPDDIISSVEGPVDRRVKAIVDYAIDTFIERTKPANRPALRTPEEILIEDWLETSSNLVRQESFSYPALDKNLTVWSWFRCVTDKMGPFKACELAACSEEFGINLSIGSAFKCVKSVIDCGFGDEKSLPVYGCVLLQHKETKARAFVMYDLCHNGYGCNFTVYSAPSDVDVVLLVKTGIDHYRTTENFYDKACLSYESGKLNFIKHDSVNWDDIVVPSEVKSCIVKNTLSVLKNAEIIYKRGLSPNRNVLLVSPPGMAKTSIFKAISNQVEGLVTRIWCTGKSISSSEDVSDLFKCARALSPCLLFVEDMDLFGRDRASSGNGYILNEFLNCLDGLHENPGIVIMASTNDHDSMDKALTHRPGRFDVKLRMPYPVNSERSEILMRQLGRMGLNVVDSVSKEDWNTVVDLTEGMTGAYLAEIAKSCFLNAITRTQDPGLKIFTIDDMRGACEQVRSNINMSGC